MMKLKMWKKFVSCILATGLVLPMTACNKQEQYIMEPGVANTDTSQTEFTIMGSISALSKGYDNNEVLKEMQEKAGIKIKWNVMSDSLGEQVNIRIAGRQLPDAFLGVGFNNYDITKKRITVFIPFRSSA